MRATTASSATKHVSLVTTMTRMMGSVIVLMSILLFLSSSSVMMGVSGFVVVTRTPSKTPTKHLSSSSPSSWTTRMNKTLRYSTIRDSDHLKDDDHVLMTTTTSKQHQQHQTSIVSDMSEPIQEDDITSSLLSSSSSILVPASVMALAMSTVLFPTEANAAVAGGGGAVVPSALWAYGHYVSIISIFGVLAAEKTLVQPNMSSENEDTVVKLDLMYGLLAALLIVSGFFRASEYGKGGDFYIHEPLFWVKMSFSGIWGGLSIFPSITMYKRKWGRKNEPESVEPISEKLAKRLQQIINAEITAMLSIPLVATFMARGVWYNNDFPWQAGLAFSILCTIGSFYLYGKQALTWSEDDAEEAFVTEKE